jgi:hypothetical protein
MRSSGFRFHHLQPGACEIFLRIHSRRLRTHRGFDRLGPRSRPLLGSRHRLRPFLEGERLLLSDWCVNRLCLDGARRWRGLFLDDQRRLGLLGARLLRCLLRALLLRAVAGLAVAAIAVASAAMAVAPAAALLVAFLVLAPVGESCLRGPWLLLRLRRLLLLRLLLPRWALVRMPLALVAIATRAALALWAALLGPLRARVAPFLPVAPAVAVVAASAIALTLARALLGSC